MKTKNTILILTLAVLGLWMGLKFFDLPKMENQGLPYIASTPAPSPELKESAVEINVAPGGILKFEVPFTPQAPLGDWSDPRQQDACEEASALMAVSWARGNSFTLAEALSEILAISDFQLEKFGTYHDTSAEDTVGRIFKAYFGYDKVEVVKNITIEDIVGELKKGNLVIVPANGQELGNPFFTSPGPERHMLVIVGYDYGANEFITNDPGTKRGQNFRYAKNVLFGAIRDYPSGYHEPILGVEKNMIVVER